MVALFDRGRWSWARSMYRTGRHKYGYPLCCVLRFSADFVLFDAPSPGSRGSVSGAGREDESWVPCGVLHRRAPKCPRCGNRLSWSNEVGRFRCDVDSDDLCDTD